MVPAAVKKELLMEMKKHLLQKFGYYDMKMGHDWKDFDSDWCKKL